MSFSLGARPGSIFVLFFFLGASRLDFPTVFLFGSIQAQFFVLFFPLGASRLRSLTIFPFGCLQGRLSYSFSLWRVPDFIFLLYFSLGASRLHFVCSFFCASRLDFCYCFSLWAHSGGHTIGLGAHSGDVEGSRTLNTRGGLEAA